MTKLFSDYANYYDIIYKTKSYKQEADFVYKWANRPKTILDLGCGTGKHIYYLAPKVEQIIGVDASLEMLNWAYIRTKKFDNIRYMFNKTDKQLLSLPKVDCVMALFNVVGYIGLEKCLKYIPLKRNGYFIFDIWDNSKVSSYSYGKKLLNDDEYRESFLTRKGKDRVKVDIAIFNKFNRKVFEEHLLTIYSKQTINSICKRYGYKIKDIRESSDNSDWTVWYCLQRI